MYAFDILLINLMQCTCLQCLHGGKIPLKVDAVDVDFRLRAFIVNSQILPKIRFFSNYLILHAHVIVRFYTRPKPL